MTHRPALSFSTLLCAVLLAGCADEPVQPIRTPDAPAASRAADPDADNVWIVRLRDVAAADVPAQARALAHSHGATLRHTFEHFGMFSVKMPAPAAAALLRNPRIVSVTPNQRLIDFSHGTQSSAPWALDRVSQRALPLNGLYTYTETGAGVHVYVVDKGIRATHQEFAGRIAEVANVYGAGGDCSDGHGTRAASFAAGSAYGVARGASIHAIDVADCTFYEEKIVAGLHHVRTSSRPWPSIVTLSSGYYPCALPPPSVPPTEPTEPGGPIIVDFSYSSSANCNAPTPLDSAVMNLIAAGVPVVVAAGNQNADACTVSPARVGTAISVGASNASDQRWFSVETVGSNYGTCVDLYAPGVDVVSATSASDAATGAATGTSFAGPLVAGGAALYLQRNPAATPAAVHQAVIDRATSGVLTGIFSGQNRLLHTLVPLTAPINGDRFVREARQYTWTAVPAGGVGHYTYQWSKRDILPDGFAMGWQTLGTASTQSRTFVGYEQDFDLRVVVTSGEYSVTTVIRVDGPCGYLRVCAS